MNANEFKYYWAFLMICAYYRVNASAVTGGEPSKEKRNVKKMASHILYSIGASGRLAGEVIGLKTGTVRFHHLNIQNRLRKNDRIRKQVDELLKLCDRVI
jgi:hypothetical protein